MPTAPAGGLRVDRAGYDAARAAVVAYWQEQLARGAAISVPDARATDAQRALLVQDLELTWRYSIGNPYEEFSFPESVDVAQVLALYHSKEARFRNLTQAAKDVTKRLKRDPDTWTQLYARARRAPGLQAIRITARRLPGRTTLGQRGIDAGDCGRGGPLRRGLGGPNR